MKQTACTWGGLFVKRRATSITILMTARVICTAKRTNDVYGPTAAPTKFGVGAIRVFTRPTEPWLQDGATLGAFK